MIWILALFAKAIFMTNVTKLIIKIDLFHSIGAIDFNLALIELQDKIVPVSIASDASLRYANCVLVLLLQLKNSILICHGIYLFK